MVRLSDVDAPKHMPSDSGNIGLYDKEDLKKLEEFQQASKVPVEHMLNNNDKCSSEWCFKTRASENGKEYNDKDRKFCFKENDNQLYNIL